MEQGKGEARLLGAARDPLPWRSGLISGRCREARGSDSEATYRGALGLAAGVLTGPVPLAVTWSEAGQTLVMFIPPRPGEGAVPGVT